MDKLNRLVGVDIQLPIAATPGQQRIVRTVVIVASLGISSTPLWHCILPHPRPPSSALNLLDTDEISASTRLRTWRHYEQHRNAKCVTSCTYKTAHWFHLPSMLSSGALHTSATKKHEQCALTNDSKTSGCRHFVRRLKITEFSRQATCLLPAYDGSISTAGCEALWYAMHWRIPRWLRDRWLG